MEVCEFLIDGLGLGVRLTALKFMGKRQPPPESPPSFPVSPGDCNVKQKISSRPWP